MTPANRTQAWWAEAVQQGLLQGKPQPDDAPSPWLIGVLMLGAMLCALPVLGTLYLLLEDALLETAGWVMAIALLLVSMGVLLRHRPIFLSCLAVVGLMVAAMWLGLLVTGKHGSSHELMHLALMELALAGVGAALVQPRWVQQALGVMVAAWLVTLLVSPAEHDEDLMLTLMLALAAVLALLWGAWVWREAKLLGKPEAARWAAVGDGFALGLLLMAVGAGWDLFIGWSHHEHGAPVWLLETLLRAPSVLVPLAGAALAGRWRAQGLQQVSRWVWLMTALLTALSAWVPGLATIGVLAAFAAATARWRLLAACGLAALVSLSRFYYDLNWTLSTKAAVLAAAGLVLGLALWLGQRGRAAGAATAPGAEPATHSAPQLAVTGLPWRWATPLIGLLGALCLLLVNVDLWRKEAVVARGEAIYVPLVPVDPRSLMQGDYMALRFDIPTPVMNDLAELGEHQVNPQALVVLGLDAQQRGTVLRLAKPGEALAANERLMPVKRMRRDWTLVTDAYFFPEGEGKRFEGARYGEFRVLPDGRALLIGLSDGDAKPIRSPHDLRD